MSQLSEPDATACTLLRGDSLCAIPDLDCVCDLIFADPPFNLGRTYGNNSDRYADYKQWTKCWLDACTAKLADGGVFVVHNIPKNAFWIAAHLSEQLEFQNWIAWKTANMPISSRLLPEHFPFLVFSKGRPKTFHSWGDLVPHKRCRHCHEILADWGGKKQYMNPKGKRVSDVWDDIERLRHRSNKSRNHNELPCALLRRFLLIYTNTGDIVLDPFMGSGSMGVACAQLDRQFIGIELDDAYYQQATQRINNVAI